MMSQERTPEQLRSDGSRSEQLRQEQALIKRSQQGDAAAFEQLAARYSRRIYNIGLRMLNDPEDAADMSQEALVKIYRHLPEFRGDSAFSTWVHRIAVNSCHDALRSRNRRRELSLSGFLDEDGEALPELNIADYSQIPEQQYLDAESSQYLLALIDGLSPKYRLVTALREVSGLSYQEIAVAADISIGTVKSRLNRARAVMRQKLQADQRREVASKLRVCADR